MTDTQPSSSGTPDLEPSSDAPHQPELERDGSLVPGSTATGNPTSLGETHLEEDAPRSPANPDSLVEGGRVATASDMESS